MVLVFLAAFVGYDSLMRSWQKQEAWSGTIERIHSDRGLFSRRQSSANHYWDVRTTGGELETIRVYSSSLWRAGYQGAAVTKREGEVDPDLVVVRR